MTTYDFFEDINVYYWSILKLHLKLDNDTYIVHELETLFSTFCEREKLSGGLMVTMIYFAIVDQEIYLILRCYEIMLRMV